MSQPTRGRQLGIGASRLAARRRVETQRALDEASQVINRPQAALRQPRPLITLNPNVEMPMLLVVLNPDAVQKNDRNRLCANAARSRRYKKRLPDFADETGLEITVSHYPPGTSKWNPIEHRLFSQIAATWAGHVLSTLPHSCGMVVVTANAQRGIIPGNSGLEAIAWLRN